jgi:type IV secretory pathway TrbL component
VTNPIRPTGPGTGLDPLGESVSSPPDAVRGGPSAPSGASQAAGAASSEVARASAGLSASGAGSPSSGAGGAARVLAELHAGHIDRAQAIEALVSQALAEPHVARLSPARQAELAGVLRASLGDDPRLSKLLG